jgi:protein-tyrosine phosphatase
MYYDVHSHILPGVDDGAKTREDAIEMARAAANSGTEVIMASPHRRDIAQNHSVPHIRDLAASINRDLERLGIKLSLVLGMENHIDPELPEEIAAGRALTMNGSRYALVEMPFHGHPDYVEQVLFQLQLQGIRPVLAHPERSEVVQRNPEFLARLVERGMLAQVTAGSVVGRFGRRVERLSHSLLRRGLVHVLASDAHFAGGPRSPDLGIGVRAAADIVGHDRAHAMAADRPRAILEDQPVETEPPRADLTPRRWWRIWRS